MASLPFDAVRLVFTDLDGTLYPGAHEDGESPHEKPGLLRNMAQVARLEAMGLPVVPATGNNVGFAQKKMIHPSTGQKLRDLATSPGIYCNGALVKGAGGAEVAVNHLGHFVPRFVNTWLRAAGPSPPRHQDIQIVGLGKSRTLLLKWNGLSATGRRTATEFTAQMMIDEADLSWLEHDQFIAKADSILSLLILLPTDWNTADLLRLQVWLHETQLLLFDGAELRTSNGAGDGIVCKHVHVPGLGPEIDISPAGVNKGSAIMKLLASAHQHLGVDCAPDGSQIAVFGDAANDVELFGMKRDRSGETLEPLGLGYRPVIRCAMPWANDRLLLADANIVSTVDTVLEKFGTRTQL